METTTQEPAEELSLAQQAEELHAAIETAFADVRAQSRDSALVTPERWDVEGMAPAWLGTEEFATVVLAIVANGPAWTRDEASEGDELEATAAQEGTTPKEEEGDDEPTTLEAAFAALPAISHGDIQVLHGSKADYLYSSDFMTDTYANWAFLAREDDKVQTFVYVVREDSRVYPRPMVYRSLLNPPFSMTEDEVLQCWQTVQETGEFPDIASCSASNGDVYFFSTDFISERYAQSLAEYESVERLMNP